MLEQYDLELRNRLIDSNHAMVPGLISLIAPQGSVGIDILDNGQAVTMPVEGWECLGDAILARRREFALGRYCAREALKAFGIRDQIIARGKRGAPVWPNGFVGSITHTSGYVAALVALNNSSVGVDAERVTDMSEGLARKLFVLEERTLLSSLNNEARNIVSTIIFSAKEAYYKAFFADRAPLLFQSMQVVLGQSEFSIFQAGRSDRGKANGRFTITGDLVLTAVGSSVN